ncbi:hypothetical protein I4F81_011265 [Pyropia yezoensis]|uniref:Uncharacterized protein n=1 Tax=Pyropia yezoensis TaxID=2788 RepID=A0ACC3CG94_PYRYE|nr:hypothetical protein I4F81_011265 [Neopyropia yezoensis]
MLLTRTAPTPIHSRPTDTPGSRRPSVCLRTVTTVEGMFIAPCDAHSQSAPPTRTHALATPLTTPLHRKPQSTTLQKHPSSPLPTCTTRTHAPRNTPPQQLPHPHLPHPHRSNDSSELGRKMKKPRPPASSPSRVHVAREVLLARIVPLARLAPLASLVPQAHLLSLARLVLVARLVPIARLAPLPRLLPLTRRLVAFSSCDHTACTESQQPHRHQHDPLRHSNATTATAARPPPLTRQQLNRTSPPSSHSTHRLAAWPHGPPSTPQPDPVPPPPHLIPWRSRSGAPPTGLLPSALASLICPTPQPLAASSAPRPDQPRFPSPPGWPRRPPPPAHPLLPRQPPTCPLPASLSYHHSPAGLPLTSSPYVHHHQPKQAARPPLPTRRRQGAPGYRRDRGSRA